MPPIELANSNFDLQPLNFILESRHVGLLAEIDGALESYSNTIFFINDRSRMLLDDIQPEIGALGVAHGSETTVEDLQLAIGTHLHQKLVVSTDLVYESVGETSNELEEQFRKLRRVSEELLMTDNLINLKLDN